MLREDFSVFGATYFARGMARTCMDSFATISPGVLAVSTHLILFAWIGATLVVRITLMFGFVQQHTVHDHELAVAQVAILVLVAISGELVQHISRSCGNKAVQCFIRATKGDLSVVVSIGGGECTRSSVVINVSFWFVHFWFVHGVFLAYTSVVVSDGIHTVIMLWAGPFNVALQSA